MRIPLLIGLILIALLYGPGLARAQRPMQKLSPRLRMLTSDNPDLVERAKRHAHIKSGPDYPEPMVDTLVRVQDDPRALKMYGAKVRSVLGHVATVDIPINALEAIANDPNVVRIEEARRLKPRLDVSVPASGANGVGLWGTSTNAPGTAGAMLRPLPPPWTGNTGKNVIVGLVDTGIDLNHGDFKDSLGKSRLLYVWDQNSSGTHPAGYTYGNECTKQKIDAGSCKEMDADGHGTHVLGIAAGNGAATGNGQPAYRYPGMAPEANLIAVNTSFYDADLIDGITYIEEKAGALGLPAAINFSLAGHLGPHDGTSIFEMAMDNATGAGRVIVAAASNEGNTDVFPGQPADFNPPIHASDLGTDKVVESSVGPTVGFSVLSGSTDVVLDLWYAGSDKMGVKVTSPGGTCTVPSNGFRYPGDTDLGLNTSCGEVGISTPSTNPANGDHEILIGLTKGSSAVKSGVWTFTLTGSGCGSSPCITNGAFDVWIDDVFSNATFDDHIDYAKTVGIPATATKVIAVGAYTTKTAWTSSKGNAMDNYGTVGEITFFSSLGPRRTCSICAMVQKPELAAPGEEIMSSHAAGTDTGVCFASSTKCLDPDKQHIVIQGTSMATPHVTGAAALLLAKNATLTSDQVKTALENAQVDGFTGPVVPNDTWGYGKLAVDMAITTVGSNAPPSHTPDPPLNVAAAAGSGSTTVSWQAMTNDIYLDGYNVYQSTSSGGPYTKANSSVLSASSTSFKVTGLTVGTPYYFVVRSVDTPGIESGDSLEVTDTPTKSSGGGGCGSIGPTGPSNRIGAVVFVLSLFLPLLFIRVRGRLRLRLFS
jgi:minor extracellular serine protease Vpr